MQSVLHTLLIKGGRGYTDGSNVINFNGSEVMNKDQKAVSHFMKVPILFQHHEHRKSEKLRHIYDPKDF